MINKDDEFVCHGSNVRFRMCSKKPVARTLPEKVNANRLHFLLYVCGPLCLGEDGLRSFATEVGIKYCRNKVNGKYLLRLNLVKTAVLNVKLDISR